MITVCRVVAVNPETQTVDILRESHYTQWVEGNLAETVSIIEGVPYGSPNIQDYGLPYVWGFLKSNDIKINNFFYNSVNNYGPNFHFGRNASPAYFKQIHEKYYKGKGSNPKTVTGGTAFRPSEGSLALYYVEANVIIGFVGTSAYAALIRDPYVAPNTKDTTAGSIFDRGYQEILEMEEGNKEEDFENIIRGSHSTLGYHSTLKLKIEDEKRLIDEYGPPDYRHNTYPVMSPYVYHQNINMAHPEELVDQYRRFKQNEYKRLSDIYNTSVEDIRTKAKKGSVLPNLYDSTLLFDDGFEYNPTKHFVSFSNMSLDNEDIFENYGEEIDGDAQFAYEDVNYHIAPESGIKHFRDGKILIYADTYNTFADFTKPTNYEEYFKENFEDSEFYNKTSWTSPLEEYRANNENYVKYLLGEDVSEDFLYKFDQYNADKFEIEGEREIVSFDERGAYIVVDSVYTEISSDTRKGGYLFFKSSKKYDLAREYEKKTVFCGFETLNQILGINKTGTSTITNSSGTYCFEHNLDSKYAYEVLTDSKIQEGTQALETPLYGVKTFREHHLSIESIALESKRSGGLPHNAGVYIGSSRQGSFASENNINDGGCVYIRAGITNPVGGDLISTTMWPESNQGGRIVLDAHEIQLNANRILFGQTRMDQELKMSQINLASFLLNLIPAEGQTVSKVGDLIYQKYPIQNKFSMRNFAPSTGIKDG
jgi:hypothetical protein